jgi:hypothetical protein
MTLDSGSRVDSDQPTYFVVLTGQFADSRARTPNGETIYGSVMTLNIDAATQGVLDFGLSDSVPPIAQLGAVTDFTNQL